jgi:hypothetical protein
MQKIFTKSMPDRRLLIVASIAALLAAVFLTQVPGLLGVKANIKAAVDVPCNSATIAGTARGWSDPGDGAIDLTASATGCSTPAYKFLLLAPGSTTWVAKTGYTTSPTYSWVTTGAKQGVWQAAVWVRQAASTAKYQSYAIRSETLLRPLCTTVRITESPASPQVAGTPVTFVSNVTNCTGPLYQYWAMAPGSNTWVVVRPWLGGGGQAGETFNWDTTGLTPGAYRIAVWVKQFDSSRSYDTYALLTYWIS